MSEVETRTEWADVVQAAARIRDYLDKVEGHNLGAQIAYGVTGAGPYALTRTDLEVVASAIAVLRSAEHVTELATRHFRDGETVREYPCPDLEYGRAALEEDRGDFPGADIRLMRRTVSTTPWEEVQ